MTTDESVLLVLLAFVVVDRLFCEFFVCLYNILTAIGFFFITIYSFVCVFFFHLLFSVCVLQMKGI